MTSSLIFESESPDGTLYALVEDDGRCVMLNLAPARHLQGRVPFRPCWVRNRVAAPERFDPSPAREGRPPLQPAPHCVDPGPRPALDVEALRVVWLQEGDGVALFEGDTLLAALPAWAGTREQPGYSAEAVGRGPMAWALHDAVDLKARIAAD